MNYCQYCEHYRRESIFADVEHTCIAPELTVRDVVTGEQIARNCYNIRLRGRRSQECRHFVRIKHCAWCAKREECKDRGLSLIHWCVDYKEQT